MYSTKKDATRMLRECTTKSNGHVPWQKRGGCTEEFCTKPSAKIHAERIHAADTYGSPGSIPHELMEFCTSSKRTFLTRLPWRGDIITHGVQTNNPPGFNPRMKLWVLCGGQEKCLRARSPVQVIMSRGVKMKDRDDQEGVPGAGEETSKDTNFE